jgi:hypothetical protein
VIRRLVRSAPYYEKRLFDDTIDWECYREVFLESFAKYLNENEIVRATGWTTEGSELESQYGQEWSLLHIVRTRSEAHTTSYLTGTGGF